MMEWASGSLILSAGMPRSGSTWLYNVVRILVERAQVRHFSSGWVDDWANSPLNKHTLLKIHNFDTEMVASSRLVLYSFRDVRDALASGERKFGQVPSIDSARHFIRQDKLWRARADFVLKCEDIEGNALPIVRSICTLLGVDGSCADGLVRELSMLADQTVATELTYHPTTLFHSGHITQGGHGTWQGKINDDLLQEIESEFGGWLIENGYPV